jgi:hypothetical protein
MYLEKSRNKKIKLPERCKEFMRKAKYIKILICGEK